MRTQEQSGLGTDPSILLPAGETSAVDALHARGCRSSWALAEVTDPWLPAASAPPLAGAVASAERATAGEFGEHGWGHSREWVRSVDGIIDPWAKTRSSPVVDAELRVIVDPWAAM